MESFAGIWIDHEKALIVFLGKNRPEMRRIESKAIGRFRLSGGSRSATPYGPQEIASEQHLDRKRDHQLHRYYHEVIDALQDAGRVAIMGPGEAKRELEKEIRKSKRLSTRLADVSPADKMTERQLVERVRKLHGELPRRRPTS